MASSEFDNALGAFYRLQSRIGHGATGEVWTAVDSRTGLTVAAKLLRSEHVADPDLVARFVTERSLLLGLRHPAIVSVRDLVVEGDRLAIVMDYVDGGSLRTLLQTAGPLRPADAARLAAAVLDGLAAAHAQGVLHRDVKPDNVLLTPAWRAGTAGSVRLTDFGIARLVSERARATTGMIGTPEYMSPELITTGECGFPADVYGAGVLLYELLAGRTPFAGPGTDFTVAHRHVTAVPPPLPLSPALWSLVSSLLDKDPAARPSAAEAAAGLRRLVPSLEAAPALAAGRPPAEFEAAVPATMVRGMPAPQTVGPVDVGGAAPAPELGPSAHETMLKPLPRPSAAPRPRPVPTAEAAPPSPWRNPRAWAAVAGALLTLVGVTIVVLRVQSGASAEPAGTAVAIRATQQDRPAPTGLTTSRIAEYDPRSQRVRLTVTYSAQNAPLSGPFLEVLPGMAPSDDCPPIAWAGAAQRRNLPSTTGISAACAWSVAVAPLPAQGSQTVSAEIALPALTEDPQAALQAWLDGAAAATSAAVTDARLNSTAYPAQRLQGIEVVVPERIASGRTLPIVLRPVWPSGPDVVNVLYTSPAVGGPTSMLAAIAGGESGVRFSDGCSGGVKVSGDGLVVTTLTVSTSCTVSAQVGNFANLSSNTFAIVTRGG